VGTQTSSDPVYPAHESAAVPHEDAALMMAVGVGDGRVFATTACPGTKAIDNASIGRAREPFFFISHIPIKEFKNKTD